MPFQTVGEVIDRVRDFHAQLRSCYHTLSQAEPDDRIAVLLDYMACHENRIDAGLAEYETEDRHAILRTWIQAVPDREVQRVLNETRFEADLEPEELIRRALCLDGALIECYRSLAATSVPPRVRELFESLATRETAKSKEYARRLLELRDEVGEVDAR